MNLTEAVSAIASSSKSLSTSAKSSATGVVVTVTSKIVAPQKTVSPVGPTNVCHFKLAVAPTKHSVDREGHNSPLKTPNQQLFQKKKKKKKVPMTKKLNCNGLRETVKEEISKLYVSSSSSDELLGHTFWMFSSH